MSIVREESEVHIAMPCEGGVWRCWERGVMRALCRR